MTHNERVTVVCSLIFGSLVGCAPSKSNYCCPASESGVVVPRDTVKSEPAEIETEQPVIRAKIIPLKKVAIVIELYGEVLLSGRRDAYRRDIAKGDTIRVGDFIEMTKDSSITLKILDEELQLTSKDGRWFKFEQQ